MMFIIIKIIVLPLLSPLCVGIIRKVKAYMQNREGASIIQPYFDIWKLFHKNEIIPEDSSWIFRVVPFLIYGLSIVLFSGIPFIPMAGKVPVFGDFLVIVYILAIMTFFLALAGIDTGSMFGGFGASREMTLAALTEGSLIFSFLPATFITHTTNLIRMAERAASLPLNTFFPITIAFFGYFIALMAETGRIPFDNAATHLELTMIHEAMILEYSGKRLALIEWANANKMLFFILIGVNIFFPWNMVFNNSVLAFIFSLFLVLLKGVVLLIIVAVLESSIAKFRLFRLPDLLLTGFIFCIIALLAIGIY